MNPTPAVNMLGAHGWLLLLLVVCGAFVRLLKTDTLNSVLSVFFGRPVAVPKKALPWIAIGLGFAIGAVDARANGLGWGDAMLMGLWGLFGGGSAVAVQETMGPLARAVFGDAFADLIFGKRADAAPKDGPKDPPAGGGAGAGGAAGAVAALVLLLLVGCTKQGTQTFFTVLRDVTGGVCPIVVQSADPQLANFPICTTLQEVEAAIQALVASGRSRASLSQDEIYRAVLAYRTRQP
jgi:hypothetical protein